MIMRLNWMILILLSLAGCDPGELDYKGEVPPRKWAVYAYVEAGSPVRVEAKRSGTYAEDAEILDTLARPWGEVYVNGEFAGKLAHREWNVYEAPARPQVGDRVAVRVGGQGCGEAVGETVVCPPPPEMEADTSFEDGCLSVGIHVRDDGRQRNYYRLQVEHWMFHTDLYLEEDVPTVRTDTFVVYNGNVSGEAGWALENSSILGARRDLNPYNLFTNEGNEGEVMDFHAYFYTAMTQREEKRAIWKGDTIRYTESLTSRVRVRLLRLDESLYTFLYTLGLYEKQFDLYKEPTRIYSNVRDGMGVVGSCSACDAVFDFQ